MTTVQYANPDEDKRFFSLQNSRVSGSHPASYSMGSGDTFPRRRTTEDLCEPVISK
jgi:hypothetical protein